ncbi:MAG: DUF58 domain-containing protein [Anaeromicrobium sp.]|jgi:uncharacterized protein (DUF58 family)|uniref:DUF58 domain-containing protein n=1 Tax=Anaeromicrobium sp. TaxID=1929132 RepID=UPI0025E4DF49|nr:DUF58 domain-containing protein [Anaeromicrobium sp.]MCT4593462.1 DUF58 domain-containing protein [Anaeromicrobium sp.]
MIIGLGIFPLLLGHMLNISSYIFIIYNVVALLVLLYDYKTTKYDENIEIDRFGDDKLSIHEVEHINFTIHNKNNEPIQVKIRDEVPDFHFEIMDEVISQKILPREKSNLSYRIVPKKRGAYEFNNIHMRIESRLKLVYLKKIISIPREYKVYPNLKNLKKYKLLVGKNKLMEPGRKSLKTIGSKTSFSHLREYVVGDEYRKINWKATARENKLIVNEYEPEKNQRIHVLLDEGRTMSGEIRGHKKLDMAIDAALLLGDISNQKGDLCGLTTFNRKVNSYVKPGKGPAHRNHILETLYHIEGSNHTSNYKEAFLHLKKKEKHRSIIFLFTDFSIMEEGHEILKHLPVISKNNIVTIVLIRDENKEALLDEKSNSVEKIYDKAVAMEMIRNREMVISLIKKRKIMCIEADKEELSLKVINKYLEIKNQMDF